MTTIDTILALADAYAQTYYGTGVPDSKNLHRNALHAALTEVFDQLDIQAGSIEAVQAANQRLAQAVQPDPWPDSLEDFEIRGKLAAGLQCWHRLTSAEAQNLISFFANQRLAQAAQPVAHPSQFGSEELQALILANLTKPAQPVREPLTDEQIDYIYNEHRGDGGPTAICEQFARAIERAHGIGSDV